MRAETTIQYTFAVVLVAGGGFGEGCSYQDEGSLREEIPLTTKHHLHDFPMSEWPFPDPDDSSAYTSSKVLHDKHPILMVSRDQEGDWQFLHGAVGEDDKCHLICLGCAYGWDRTVGQVADLPLGWQAIRSSVNEPWERLPPEPDSTQSTLSPPV